MKRVNLYLEQVFLSTSPYFKNGTPSNYIIFKKLCGLGATHGEATIYKRHSIIIVPNTPVLRGKKNALDENGNKKYKDILVVYEAVHLNEVEQYLNNEILYKKILCTPEAYITKVKPAIEANDRFDIYNDFFMLFDESDKVIKDSDFRPNMIIPMNDFFKFKKKSMISATAMLPTDKRFEDHNFTRLYVKPQYIYKKKVKLIHTNNVINSLHDELIKHDPKEKIYIFLNCVDLILAIIKILKIENKSKVFCAKTSKTKLSDTGFNNASAELTEFSQYNFFTSKFYTAVDIELPEKPHIILITDVLRKAFSMLDPYSDSIQINGRFRNGTSSITHITNSKKNQIWRDNLRAINYLNDGFSLYKDIEKLRNHSDSEGRTDNANRALEGTFIHNYIMENGELNTYLVDNYILDQQVIGYYTNISLLNQAYIRSNFWKPTLIKRFYNVNDSQIISLELKNNRSQLIKNVVEILKADELSLDDGELKFSLGRGIEELNESYSEYVRFYKILGYDHMKSLGFNYSMLVKAYTQKEKNNALDNPQLIAKIKSFYNEGDKPLEMEIIAKIQLVYKDFGIKEKATNGHVKKYFNATRSTDKQNVKCWNIKGRL